MKRLPAIVMTETSWQQLYAHLIRVSPETPRPVEQMAFLLASTNRSALGTRMIVREMVLAGPGDFVHQSRGGLEPKAEFVAATIKRCMKEGWHLIEVHSHPLDSSERTSFSSIDQENDRKKMPALASIISRPFMHATMVIGQNTLDAHYYDRASKRIRPIFCVTRVGEHIRHMGTTASKKYRSTRKSREERYQRQELFFGHATQQALGQATVAIVGLGGLGSLVATQLAHLGVGHLILIDPDRVERSNLNRLLGAGEADVGRLKVEVYADQVKRISEKTRVTSLPISLLDREDRRAIDFARGADLIAGCVDNDGARLILNQLAVRYMLPLVDAGTGIHLDQAGHLEAFGGQVQLVLPGAGCLECRGYIDPQRAHFDLAPLAFQQQARDHGYGSGVEAPAVIYLNGIIASQQVAEIVFLLANASLSEGNHPSLIVYNGLKRKLTPLQTSLDPDCPTCGLDGLSGVGDFAPLEFASSTLTREAVEQIMSAPRALNSALAIEQGKENHHA